MASTTKSAMNTQKKTKVHWNKNFNLKYVRRIVSIAKLDFGNFMAHGKKAPFYSQLIQVDPNDCSWLNRDLFKSSNHRYSGKIVEGNWDIEGMPLLEHPKINACYLHWEKGVDWKDTGVYEYLLDQIKQRGVADFCTNIEQIKMRYEKLDVIFEQMRKEKRMLTGKELGVGSFRGEGNGFIHFGRNGAPVYGGGFLHRFAAARILRLSKIPAQVGLVHPKGINLWHDFIK